MAFPNWMTHLNGNTYVVDPDMFYTQILDELGVGGGNISRYWLEVAQGCMKLDFDIAIRQEGGYDTAKNIERLIRSDDGRKQTWNLTMFPMGELDWEKMNIMKRAAEIRKHYKRIRGFVPVI